MWKHAHPLFHLGLSSGRPICVHSIHQSDPGFCLCITMFNRWFQIIIMERQPQSPEPHSPVPKKRKCEPFLQSIQSSGVVFLVHIVSGPTVECQVANEQADLAVHFHSTIKTNVMYFSWHPPPAPGWSPCNSALPLAMPLSALCFCNCFRDWAPFHEFQQSPVNPQVPPWATAPQIRPLLLS